MAFQSSEVRVTPGGDPMINVQRVGAGAAVHLIRYDFDPEHDCTPPLPEGRQAVPLLPSSTGASLNHRNQT